MNVARPASLIRQPLQRQEDPRLLEGTGRDVGDLAPAGMLHMAVLRTPHAHARILAHELDDARPLPGVLAVLSYDDVASLAPLPVFIQPPVAESRAGAEHDYAIPRGDCMGAPVLEHLGTPSPHTPGRVKEMSEGGTVAPPAAIANAVADALSAQGVDRAAVDAYPLTPPRLFAPLRSGWRA